MNCNICEKKNIRENPIYHTLGRSTSDCKPWKSGGRIGVCQYCGVVQKIIDAKWQIETTAIYSSYEIYHQSPNRSEQPIYIAKTNTWIPRSKAILLNFLEHIGSQVPHTGKAMDIGCGNGATLQAMLATLPQYERYGYDPTATNIGALQDRTELQVTACSRELKDLPATFDLLTMIHVLEHIPNPLPILRQYVEMLNPNGYFIIAVPNFLENPFDITIADHCSHFCSDTLNSVLRAVGLEIITLSISAIPKEILAICRKAKIENINNLQQNDKIINRNTSTLSTQVSWLNSINAEVSKIVNINGRFGVLGTSIAGNWMFGEWGKYIKFFVDEDPDRIGTTYRGVPVLSFKDLNNNDLVYVALPSKIATKVKERYLHTPAQIFEPPTLELQGHILSAAIS